MASHDIQICVKGSVWLNGMLKTNRSKKLFEGGRGGPEGLNWVSVLGGNFLCYSKVFKLNDF